MSQTTTKRCAMCGRLAFDSQGEKRAVSCVIVATDDKGQKLPQPPGRENNSGASCEECGVSHGGVHHGFCSRR